MPTPTTQSQLGAALGIVTAMAGALRGQLDHRGFGGIVGSLLADQGDPLEVIPALATISVRLAYQLGQATGRDLDAVLADLGVELSAPLPDGLQ